MRKTTEADITRYPHLEELEGYLWRREGARLAYLAERVPAGQVIVEVGSNRGKSTCYLATGSKAGNRVRVHAVDLWTEGGQGEYVHLGFDPPETFAKFREQVAGARCKSLVVEHMGRSVDVAQQWEGPSIGLLFIDGDHRYGAVAADIAAWVPHVEPGGWVCFHDYTRHTKEATQFPGVVRAVDEWLATLPRDVEVTRTGRLVAVRLP